MFKSLAYDFVINYNFSLSVCLSINPIYKFRETTSTLDQLYTILLTSYFDPEVTRLRKKGNFTKYSHQDGLYRDHPYKVKKLQKH